MREPPWKQMDCPLCNEIAWAIGEDWDHNLDCPVCGKFRISGEAADELKDHPDRWSNVALAALSHKLRTRNDIPVAKGSGLPLISTAVLSQLFKGGLGLPVPTQQARNIVRYIGDAQRSSGKPLPSAPPDMRARIGSVDADDLNGLIRQLKQRELVDCIERKNANASGVPSFLNLGLTLSGWEQWERLHKGDAESRDGFIAMQFSDDYVGAFIRDVVQKSVQETLGVAVHRLDSPDKLEAGLIDNIMREAIEDAGFVLVELSHGNRGAYWEAGLAEGLGKPVIYLCEDAIWNAEDKTKRPHFDVLHRQTVMWNRDKPHECVANLIATIRNSLRVKDRQGEKAG